MRLSPPLVRLLPWVLASFGGILYGLGFPDARLWLPAWFAFIPLLWALEEARTWKRALALSWVMGLSAHLFVYHWLIHMFREFAHLPVPLAVLGYVLLCLAQSGSIALAGFGAWALARRSPLSLGATLPLAVVASEILYPLLFQSYLANTQAGLPAVTQIADLGGAVMVSGLVALVSGGLFELLRHRRARLALGALGALSAAIVYGQIRIAQMEALEEEAPTLKTAIIQANVGAGDKHLRASEGIRKYRRMTDEAMRIPGIGLVVWPESGLNRAVPSDAKNIGSSVASRVEAPMIVGAVRVERGERRKVWNTALALERGGDIVGHYDKIELLAFGEYIPGGELFPAIYDLLPYSSHFERGKTVAPLPVGEYRLSTNICYEDILPSLVRRLMGPIDEAGTRPHALVNLTNDSWYGPSEPPIHLSLATFRSIEHRRWMIRSTSTGISAFIDSAGRIVQRSGFETEEILVHDVPMIEVGPTVYGRLGDTFGWLATAAAVALLAFGPRLRRGEETGQERAAA